MKRNNKKGFTIVELVIVIAVIAILAAVLIPTFSSVIKKAKVNNDIQLVRNLNTALATANKKHKTMQSALDSAAEFGYDVAKINASATDNEILWDSVNDVFCYLNNGEIQYVPNSVDADKALEVNSYKLWKIYGENDTVPAATAQTYSIYYNGATWAEESNAYTVSVGFDAGTTKGITAIEYKNTTATPQEVVICTNGGTLTIDAEQDDIAHYGYADSVNIVAVAPDTYRENGKVGFTQIAKGHYVAEAGAEVLVVLATGSADDVTIDNNGATIDKAYTTVATSQNTLHGGNESLAYYEVTPTGTQTQEEALAEAIKNLETGATLFAGGTGTENDPYLISDYYQMLNISNLCVWSGQDSKYLTGGGHAFKVKDGIDIIDCKGLSLNVYLSGSFDGNGVTFTNLNSHVFDRTIGETGVKSEGSSVIKNFTVVFGSNNYGGVLYWNTCKNLTMEHITVHGYIEGSYNIGSFIDYGGNSNNSETHVTISNCYSDATIVATQGATGAFIGHPFSNAQSTFTITNTTYGGHSYSSSGENGCKYFAGYCNGTVTCDIENFNANSSLVENRHKINVTNGTNPEKYGVFSIEKISGCTSAVAILTIGPDGNGTTLTGGYYCSDYMSEELDVSGQTITTHDIIYFDITSNGDATTKTGISSDGHIFNVVNKNYNNVVSGASVRIIQYDAQGNILQITTWNITPEN